MIRARRLELALSQAQLAGKTAVSKTAICMMENGYYDPPDGRLARIAAALDMPPDSLKAAKQAPGERARTEGARRFASGRQGRRKQVTAGRATEA